MNSDTTMESQLSPAELDPELKKAVDETLAKDKEPKPLRSKAEVVEEYKQIAGVIGDRSYRMKLLEAELMGLYQRINGLDTEKTLPEAPQAPAMSVVPSPEATS